LLLRQLVPKTFKPRVAAGVGDLILHAACPCRVVLANASMSMPMASTEMKKRCIVKPSEMSVMPVSRWVQRCRRVLDIKGMASQQQLCLAGYDLYFNTMDSVVKRY
jgi:hypothetical protein